MTRSTYDVILTTGLTYREVDEELLSADLYKPVTELPPPIVVYVHGGGFQFGSRRDDSDTRLRALAQHGLAVLSIDYRLAPAARFPAQILDVRAAVEWVRSQAPQLGLDGERIALWGASAGASLASLAALTSCSAHSDSVSSEPADHVDLAECQVGAVVAWFGLSDLLDSASRSWLEAEILPFAFEAALLGVDTSAAVIGDPEAAGRARRASPLSWVTADAPPFLIAHGDRDRITPISQSQKLHDALVRVGASSTFCTVGGAGHEDRAFESEANLALTAAWIKAALHQEKLQGLTESRA